MTNLRLGGAVLATSLGLGLAAACGSDDGQRANPRGTENPGGAGAGAGASPSAGEAGAGAGGSSIVGGSSSEGGTGGDSTPGGAAGAGAGGEPLVSGGAAGADPGTEGGAAGAGGSNELPLDLSLVGCVEVAGDRPPSSGTVPAPQVADLELAATDPGESLSGSLAFADADPKELIVQVGGSAVHYVCQLSASELDSKVAQFAPLSLNPAFPEGSRLLYFGVRDRAGNVSAYLVGNLPVGQGGSTGVDVCGAEQSVLLMGAIPSASTTFYQQTNGVSSAYRLNGGVGGQPLIVVSSTSVPIDLGACTTLRLAGDAAGTKPLGWDNCLVIEYRAVVGEGVTNAWSFCGDYGSVYSIAPDQALPVPLRPTLPGSALTPPVPSGLSFGYAPLAIDLAALIPAGDKEFELRLHVLDFGDVGSTTEVWAIGGVSEDQ